MLRPPLQRTPQAPRRRVHARDKAAGGRDQSGRDLISSAGCGPYSNVCDGEGAHVPTPPPRSRRLTSPRRSAYSPSWVFFISVLGKVSVEFPFYRNLNGGSEAEVKCPSHLDDECKSQGSI